MVTLGGWDHFVGTDFFQASTLMHELGHNFGRSHGGDLAQLNGKPNFLSVMNYLFQLNGLFDDNPAHAGIPQIDFSGEALSALNESNLSDLVSGLLPGLDARPPRYRTAWYAPQGPGTSGSGATKHSNGTPLSEVEEAARLAGHGMVRIDAPGVTGPGAVIDWNADGDHNLAGGFAPFFPRLALCRMAFRTSTSTAETHHSQHSPGLMTGPAFT